MNRVILRGAALCALVLGLLASDRLPAIAADAPAHPIKITIYGDNALARAIAVEATRRGDHVTALIPAAAGPGSVVDVRVVARQIAGQDVVIAALEDGDQSFLTAAAKTLTTSARIVGTWTPRIFWIGSWAALKDDHGELMLDTLPPESRTSTAVGQVAVLAYLRGVKDVLWTYLAPPLQLSDGKRTGKFRLGSDHVLASAGDKSILSRADLAVAAINEAEKPLHLYDQFTVAR